MKRYLLGGLAAVACLLALGLWMPSLAAEKERQAARPAPRAGGEREKAVRLSELPTAVRETVEKEASGKKILEIEESTKGGKTVYEAEWADGKQEVEIVVAADGKVLARHTEAADEEDGDNEDGDKEDGAAEDRDDEHAANGKKAASDDADDDEDEEDEAEEAEKPVTLEALPKAVRDTILKQAKKAKIAELVETRIVVYEAEWVMGNREVEIVVAADGKVLKREVEPLDKDEPAAQQGKKAAAHKQATRKHVSDKQAAAKAKSAKEPAAKQPAAASGKAAKP